MPGSPILYYGDEIGMGDNIYLGDRDGVRTPMQWRPERNAGFSRADPQRLYLPPIMDAIYGYEAVNVEAQLREPSSLLNWTRRLTAGAQRISFVRPRKADVPAARQSQDPRLHSRIRRRSRSMRGQPRTQCAAGRARSVALQERVSRSS